GNPTPVMAKWVNLHGTEVFAAMQQKLREPVTLTLRYAANICDQKLTIKKELGDDDDYEIISIDDVENRHAWLELKIQRKVAAK
ncbi:MAG: head-tail adaptor protein, partial [Oscillospiraceae bacterium]